MSGMAMGRARRQRQGTLFVGTGELPRTPGHPFYEKVSALLEKHGFEAMVEGECARYYSDVTGRPIIPPVVYFKALFVGFFEALTRSGGSRGGWRTPWPCALFWWYELTEATPDHSSLSGPGG
jgi:hypothetical protein